MTKRILRKDEYVSKSGLIKRKQKNTKRMCERCGVKHYGWGVIGGTKLCDSCYDEVYGK